jgi:hypothetical protein
MMIGEFEYEGIFNGDIEPQSINVTYAFFIGFLVVMSIIIVNLLVGLAVDDIKAVQDQALLKRLAMQVELVLDVERLMPEPILRRFIKHSDTFQTSASTDLEFKTLLKLWSINRIGSKSVEDTKSDQDKWSEIEKKMYKMEEMLTELKDNLIK